MLFFKNVTKKFITCSFFAFIMAMVISLSSVLPVFASAYFESGKSIIVRANSETVESTEPEDDLTAWNLSALNSEYAHSSGYTGEGVKICIVDSGIDIYSEVYACGGVDLEDPEYCNGDDLTGHGSAVAGIIAAPDDGSGTVGIAPDAQIYNVRVLDGANQAPVSRIIDALDWCIANNMDIVNMSFGTDEYSPALKAKVEEVSAHGIIMISSAGNGETVQYPAAFPEVISVSSVNSSMQKPEGTATGDFSAPGINIYSTSLLGGYCAVSGSSIAAAHITGCAAVLLGIDTSKSAEFIKDLLIYSCKGLGNSNDYGCGIPDLEFAVDNYNTFSADYSENNDYVSSNTTFAENFSDEDIFVEGQWSTEGHYGLADNFFNGTSYDMRFPKFIKIVSYTCDKSFPSVHPLHGNSNYIVAAKLLYEIAVKYKTQGSSFDHINYRSDLANLLIINGKSYYNDLINSISEMFLIFINGKKSEVITYHSEDALSVIYDNNDIILWDGNSFVSLSQKKATIVYGMCFHLLGDLYAHRSIVPTMAINDENRKGHGSGEGENEGRYYVLKDFVDDCKCHVANVDDKIDERYNSQLSEIYNNYQSSKGFYKILFIFEYIIFLLLGRNKIESELEAEKVQKQKEIDKNLLLFAQNIPTNISSMKICSNAVQNFCYGAVRRITGLGIMQYKDLKRALKYSNSNLESLKSIYKSNQAYYEDQAPGNEFYKRRYLVAKKITARFTEHFLLSKANETIYDFLPYDLISEDYGNEINKYTVKIDRYYNYLKEFDANSAVLKESIWNNKSYSLFHYTTVIFNGNYYIDPNAYIDGEKPTYYSVPFPQSNLSYSDFYYGGAAW